MRWLVRLAAPGAVCAIALATCGWEPSSSPPPEDIYRLGIKISSETTQLTEPILPNGAPDYAAGMNVATGMGVTPTNNAVPGLATALGMSFSKKIQARLDLGSTATGTTADRANSGRFAGGFSRERFEEYLRNRPGLPAPTDADLQAAWDAFSAERQVLRDGYCSTKHCPRIAEWVRANEGPLAAVAKAVQKPRYWVPLEDGENLYRTTAASGHGSQERFGDVCSAIAARAELRLADEDFRGAAEDVGTVHRLAVLLGQSPLWRDQLVAAGCIHVGNEALRRIATGPVRDAAAAKSLLEALDPLPQIGNFEIVVQHERFVALAGIFLLRELIDREGTDAWRDALDGSDGSRPEGFYRLTVSSIDWNLAVKLVNDSWDLVRELLWTSNESGEEARKKLRDGMRWTAETGPTLQDPVLSDLIENVDRSTGARPRLTRAFVDAAGFLPRDVPEFLRAVNEPLAGRELGLLALALAVHRVETGKLPDAVEALVPGYLERIPPARQFGHVLRVTRGETELALTLVPETPGVTGTASYCVDTEGRSFALTDGSEPGVVDGRCQPPTQAPSSQ